MSDNDHYCHQNLNFDEIDVDDEMHNERVGAEAPCSVCGETVTLSFYLDYYEYDGETHYHP